MPAYQSIFTNLGLAKVAKAIADDVPLSLTTMKVGDGNGNPTTPIPTQTDLVRVVHSTTLSLLNVPNPAQPQVVLAEAVVTAAYGGWTIREAGLYDADGDLIIVCNMPSAYKPLPSEGSSRDLVVRIVFQISNSDAVTMLVDNSVTIATREWVTNNFSLSALIPGGTTHQILRKVSNANGDYEWADPLEANNVTVNVIEENQTLATSQTVVTLAVCTTNAIAVFVEGVRLRNDEYTVNTATQLTLDTSYPDGSKITITQNEPNGSIDFLRTLNSLSEIADEGAGAQEAARDNLGLGSAATQSAAGVAKAWVLFDGSTTPPTVHAQHNVASVTRLTTGRYKVAFTTPMGSVHYAVSGQVADDNQDGTSGGGYETWSIYSNQDTVRTVDEFEFYTTWNTQSDSGVSNPKRVSVIFFGL